jgi:hypothetical protein
MVKVMLLDVSAEVPPPYMPPAVPGFVTVTVAVPAAATSASGTAAVIRLALVNVVANAVPFQLMVALPLKFVPVTMNELPVVPAFTLFGERAVMLGMLPATAGVVGFELYPHAKPTLRSTLRNIVFASFILFSYGFDASRMREAYEIGPVGVSEGCHFHVNVLSTPKPLIPKDQFALENCHRGKNLSRCGRAT